MQWEGLATFRVAKPHPCIKVTAKRRQQDGKILGKTGSMSKLGSSVHSELCCFAFFQVTYLKQVTCLHEASDLFEASAVPEREGSGEIHALQEKIQKRSDLSIKQ